VLGERAKWRRGAGRARAHGRHRLDTEEIEPTLIPLEGRVGEALGPGACGETECALADVLHLRDNGELPGDGRLHARLSGETSLSSQKSGVLASSTSSFTGVSCLTEARTLRLTEACDSRLTEVRTALTGAERDAERAGVENGGGEPSSSKPSLLWG
jgi:hypothetical protein